LNTVVIDTAHQVNRNALAALSVNSSTVHHDGVQKRNFGTTNVAKAAEVSSILEERILGASTKIDLEETGDFLSSSTRTLPSI
jgi:hypothetical protein